jgi:ribosomal protein L11 methyltransferase
MLRRMIELRVNVDPILLDALSGCLFEAGAEGLAEQEDDAGTWLVAYCDDDRTAACLSAAVEEFRQRAKEAFPEAEVGCTLLRPVDSGWQDAWLDALQPAQLTERLVLRPTHHGPAPTGENTLWIHPASCFGSGDHPTTRLAARAIEKACLEATGSHQDRTTSELTLLDVGSGTGVLCFVALRSGATEARGLDIDDVAVSAAVRNAELNELASLCTFCATPLQELSGTYDLVAANIDAPTLRALARPLLDHVVPGGLLLLTGLLEEQEPDVLGTFLEVGAQLRFTEREGDWVLLGLRPGTPPSN